MQSEKLKVSKLALKKIKDYATIIIFGHTSPDGDCYGAQSGLKAFIKEYFPKKDVFIVGSGFPRAIPFFGEMDIVEDDVFKNALGVVVDVSDIERIEDQRVHLCHEVIKIDHHMKSDVYNPFFSVNVSDTKVSSASQMIGHLILNNHYRLTKDIAERLFLGIVTDSGRFSFLNSASGMFMVLDEILKTNIDFQKIYDFLYEGDEIATRAKGYIAYNFKKTNAGVAYIVLNKETLHSLNIDFNYAAGMVNSLSGMKEFPIWALFAESDEGLVRVELRAKKYNVQQVAVKFGGGGHLQASGLRLQNVDDYIKVIEELDKLLEV